MEEKLNEKNEAVEIDLRRLFVGLLRKSWLIGIAAAVCAAVSLLGTLLFVTPQYQSSVMFYVNNNSMALGDAALSISSADISASRGLVKSYIVILHSRESLNEVIDYAEVEYSYGELQEMITAQAVDSTEIFRVNVTGPDAEEACKIADAIAYILPERIASVIEGTSAKVVDSPVVAAGPSSPDYVKNTLIGFLLGLALSAGAVILWVLLDTTIRTEDDVAQNFSYPVLAAVPDMEAPGGDGCNYGYDRGRRNMPLHPGSTPVLIGGGVNFAAAEAYKLLRTKLQFSFADENKSRVIGVSSALSGEGKSLSAVNLAYTLSQLGKRVILIDCDMRRPTLAEKLNIRKKPGLSDFLTGQCDAERMIQFCGLKDEGRAFHVVTAGQNPPNPVELLSSVRMARLLQGLRDICDYIILDFPPVSEVSDALAVAKRTDGFLLVVRQDRCNRQLLKDAIRQFEFVDTRILGVVYNCASDHAGKYGKGYHKSYYQKPPAHRKAPAKPRAKHPAAGKK